MRIARLAAVGATLALGSTLVVAAPASAASSTWDCRRDRKIAMDGSWELRSTLIFPTHKLVAQKDGNLVLRNKVGKALWHSRTPGPTSAKNEVWMRADGSIAIYRNGRPIKLVSGYAAPSCPKAGIFPPRSYALTLVNTGRTVELYQTTKARVSWQTKYIYKAPVG